MSKAKIVPIDAIHIDPSNVRIHPQRNLATIRASLARFGAGRSIVLDGNNVVRAGNGTVEQARDAGYTEVLVVEPGPNQIVAVKRPDWSDSVGTAYSIADNTSTDQSEDDQVRLAATLEALRNEGFDLGAMGHSSEGLDELLKTLADETLANGTPAEPPEDPGPQIDRADELQKKWGTAPGQLWLIPSKTTSGDHRILCGDSTKPDDVTRACGGQVQMCVTSPPYWGLRDYGTASWEGGDKDCDHKSTTQTRGNIPGTKQATNNNGEGGSTWTVCGKCGARRIDSQLGLEATPEAFVAAMTGVFAEVKRVLRDDSTCWINLGDSYAGGGGYYPDAPSNLNGSISSGGAGRGGAKTKGTRAPEGLKPKDLVGIPWRVAFALQADGWYLRSDIIWHKPNPMPESVTDRPTKAHEYIFLMAKQERYYWDGEAVREDTPAVTPREFGRKNAAALGVKELTGNMRDGVTWQSNGGRNTRSVWTITPQPFKEAHFATFPVELAARCISAGTSQKGACPTCGAPWEREVERTALSEIAVGLDGDRPKLRARQEMGLASNKSSLSASNSHNDSTPQSPIIKTLGWRPTCSHDADPQPCTVLDPFLGAATTIVACEQLGRLGRGIELSPQYVAIALERLEGLGLAPVLAES